MWFREGRRTMIDVGDNANVADVWLIQLQFLEFLSRYERHFYPFRLKYTEYELGEGEKGRSVQKTAPKATDKNSNEFQLRPSKFGR